jgi:DNA polymerase epsilon subunit 2
MINRDLKPTSILSGPDARHQMYHDRYYSIYTRLDQNNVPKRLTRQGTQFLNSTKSILGRSTGRFTLFGMLTIIDNSIHLQDPDGFIPLSFENCEPTEDLFTDHCMVLIHGQLDPDKLFSVEKIEFPSHEFTKPHSLPPSHPYHPSNQPPFSLSQGQIELIQEQSSDVYMIVLSDFFLDQQKVIDDFQTLLTNINQSTSAFPTVPLAFILCGNFISNPINSNSSSVSNYASGFSRLAQCLSKFPKICSWSHFIFIPGPDDFSISSAIPHAPLLNYLVKPLKETLRNTHFTTNPTKILFCKRELNIYRQDLSQQIHRNQLIQLGKDTGDRNHFSQINLLKTISQGGHLSPIPINCQPIHPDFDHSLRLDYLPDILILPDSNTPYTIPTDYCLYGNPGSFSNGGDFMVYFPKDNQCDLKNVNSV